MQTHYPSMLLQDTITGGDKALGGDTIGYRLQQLSIGMVNIVNYICIFMYHTQLTAWERCDLNH